MADISISPISGNSSTNSDASVVGALNNNQITSMLANGSIDPKFATLLLNQMTTNNVNSILFGSGTGNTTSTDSSFDPFTGMSELGNGSNTNDMFGISSMNSSVTPQFEMSVYSSLIGRTIRATLPVSNQQIEGKVTGMSLQNGQAMLEVNGKLIPIGNLLSIKE